MKPSDIRYAKDLAVALKLCAEEQFVVDHTEDDRHNLEFCGFMGASKNLGTSVIGKIGLS